MNSDAADTSWLLLASRRISANPYLHERTAIPLLRRSEHFLLAGRWRTGGRERRPARWCLEVNGAICPQPGWAGCPRVEWNSQGLREPHLVGSSRLQAGQGQRGSGIGGRVGLLLEPPSSLRCILRGGHVMWYGVSALVQVTLKRAKISRFTPLTVRTVRRGHIIATSGVSMLDWEFLSSQCFNSIACRCTPYVHLPVWVLYCTCTLRRCVVTPYGVKQWWTTYHGTSHRQPRAPQHYDCTWDHPYDCWRNRSEAFAISSREKPKLIDDVESSPLPWAMPRRLALSRHNWP